MTAEQFVVTGPNLSHVWAQVFLRSTAVGVGDSCPLVVTITGFDDDGKVEEDTTIREALDDSLETLKTGLDCRQVASTIFPASLWNPDRPREELYARFNRIWPKIAKCSRNRRGHYFRRLTKFGTGRHANQLEYIIKTYRGGNHRRSALQAALLDPALDHTDSRQQGFPCLQQVSFIPLGNGEMCVTGFYGLQYLVKRAYGNYLGLCNLGQFMAHEMGLRLARVTCIASAANLDFTKTGMSSLATSVRKVLPVTEFQTDGTGVLH